LKISTGEPMTRLSSKLYCKKRRPPPNSCFEKRTSTSPLTSGPRTSSEERSLHRWRHNATQTSNPTGARRKGHVRRCMPSDHSSLEPEEHPRGRANTGQHPRRLVLVPQGHVPHPTKVQGLQALCGGTARIIPT
jgi:hypothetical protein